MGILHEAEFWVLIAAIVLVALIWRPVGRSIVGSLDSRARRIRAELDEARSLRDEAQQTLAEYQRKQRDAAEEAKQILAHAAAEAERIAAQSARDLEQALERRQRLAQERIAQAEQKALVEIRATAVDLAIAAARDVLAAHLDEPRQAALIDAAIADLPRQLH
jgi:F-type H+-transporting ATPase subunit b